jgi:hypothetical protein
VRCVLYLSKGLASSLEKEAARRSTLAGAKVSPEGAARAILEGGVKGGGPIPDSARGDLREIAHLAKDALEYQADQQYCERRLNEILDRVAAVEMALGMGEVL